MFNIFSSYLSINNFKFDIKKYKKEILNIKMKSKGRIVSNYGGWQSDEFKTVSKTFTDLFNKINEHIKEIEKNLSLEKKLRFNNLWYNVNRLSSFNRPHSHPGSVISGVYYVSVPKNSGSIIFLNRDLDSFFKGYVNKYNEYTSTIWKINPKENECILFPSYLEHYVEPNLNKKERISISFNYGF